MENRIPLPTDNIYKFYALFSLLLLIFSIGSSIYVIRSTNAQVVPLFIELETLKEEKDPSRLQQLRRDLIARQLEVLQSDKNTFSWSLIVLGGLSFAVMLHGFSRWHKEVQPIADETARVQLEIAKLQFRKLQIEVANIEKASTKDTQQAMPAE